MSVVQSEDATEEDARVSPYRSRAIHLKLSPLLLARLALYQAEKYSGRQWLRSMIVEEIIDEFLKRKGY